jgi:hypothetical protein
LLDLCFLVAVATTPGGISMGLKPVLTY